MRIEESLAKKLTDLYSYFAAAGRSFLLRAQNKRTKEKGTRHYRLSPKRLYFTAWVKTRCAQTLTHVYP